MVLISKTQAGDAGYPDGTTDEWPTDGAVVDVTPEHAAMLLSIPFAGFSEVTADQSAPTPAPVDAGKTGRRAVREN